MIACLASHIGGSYKVDGKRFPTYLNEVNGMTNRLSKVWKQNTRMIIISSDPDDYEGNDIKKEVFYQAFQMSGLPVSNIDFCDHRTVELAEQLMDYDVIMLTGGHVPTQNMFFQEISLREKMLSYDGIVIGISAGSMNSADIVYAQPELEGESIDQNYQRFLPGLGITEVNILPHYQVVKDEILDGKRVFEDITYPDSYGRKFYALVDGSYLWIQDGTTMLYGEGYLIAEGTIAKICSVGECVELNN